MEGNDLNKVLTDLSNKIDSQARFTRSLVVICCMAVIGVIYYTFIQLFNTLPDQIIMTYMGKLSDIQTQWKVIENTQIKNAAAKANK